MDDTENLDMVHGLVDLANANQLKDAADLKQCIQDHDLVFGVWQEDGSPGGFGTAIIKGKGSLSRIVRLDAAEGLALTAIRCRDAEEAEAMRQVYGDEPAQVLPLRDS